MLLWARVTWYVSIEGRHVRRQCTAGGIKPVSAMHFSAAGIVLC